MNLEDAIACLKANGYRVSKPRQKAIHTLGTTTKWPPEKGQRYVGAWPPAFKTPGVYRAKPLKQGDGVPKPLPSDWAERTAALAAFMSRDEIAKIYQEPIAAAKSGFREWPQAA